MDITSLRKLEKIVGRESYLAVLARKDLASQGCTELDDIKLERASEVHEAQMDAMTGYMRKSVTN